MLSGFATNQGNTNFATGLSNSAHDIGNALWHNFSAGDVIGHEQTLCANHNDVVNHHANKILANGVVLIDCLRDGDLGANAIGAGCKKWPVILFQE